MTTGVSDSKSPSAGKTSDAGRTTGAASTERASAASLSRDMGRVSARDVQAEAGRVAGADLVSDGVDRAAKTADLAKTADPTKTADPAKAADAAKVEDAPVTAATGPLQKGDKGPEVEALQQRLSDLGYDVGTVDGDYGRRTERAVRQFQLNNELPLSGTADATTRARIHSPEARPPDPNKTEFPTYTPGSPEQIALFEEAARQAGLPTEWASSPGLIHLLESESGGTVGKPNYTYGNAVVNDQSRWHEVHEDLQAGRITAESSATGLGQLLLSNVDRFYPSGRAGIGNPTEEAVGMLRYIEDRYGTPDNAWEQYNSHHEGY